MRFRLGAQHLRSSIRMERGSLRACGAGSLEHVAFENIGGSLVQKSAMTTAGSGGPSKVDAETWKNMLCSKAYGEFSWNLAEE